MSIDEREDGTWLLFKDTNLDIRHEMLVTPEAYQIEGSLTTNFAGGPQRSGLSVNLIKLVEDSPNDILQNVTLPNLLEVNDQPISKKRSCSLNSEGSNPAKRRDTQGSVNTGRTARRSREQINLYHQSDANQDMRTLFHFGQETNKGKDTPSLSALPSNLNPTKNGPGMKTAYDQLPDKSHEKSMEPPDRSLDRTNPVNKSHKNLTEIMNHLTNVTTESFFQSVEECNQELDCIRNHRTKRLAATSQENSSNDESSMVDNQSRERLEASPFREEYPIEYEDLGVPLDIITGREAPLKQDLTETVEPDPHTANNGIYPNQWKRGTTSSKSAYADRPIRVQNVEGPGMESNRYRNPKKKEPEHNGMIAQTVNLKGEQTANTRENKDIAPRERSFSIKEGQAVCKSVVTDESSMDTIRTQEQVLAYNVGLDVFGPGIFGMTVFTNDQAGESKQYKREEETHLGSPSSTSLTVHTSTATLPKTTASTMTFENLRNTESVPTVNATWNFHDVQFLASKSDGGFAKLPVVGKTTQPGPLAVSTLDSVFRALAKRDNIPTALVNLCLEKVYAIESHEDLPDGSMTLLSDHVTAVWKGKGSNDSPRVGAFQAIIQLRPKDTPPHWIAPLLSPETEEEAKTRKAVDKWVEHVLATHTGGKAEEQGKADAGPVRDVSDNYNRFSSHPHKPKLSDDQILDTFMVQAEEVRESQYEPKNRVKEKLAGARKERRKMTDDEIKENLQIGNALINC